MPRCASEPSSTTRGLIPDVAWPTLVFLRDGIEVERLFRPRDVATIRQALRRIGAS